MTRDDVFRWSQEARVASDFEPVNITALQRFAALVAAAEQEACALECEKVMHSLVNEPVYKTDRDRSNQQFAASQCVYAIRSRSKP